MNEEYLQGFYGSYIQPSRPDVTYEQWRDKIKDNEEYKSGMFNNYVKPAKSDASYDDWNTKIFGGVTPPTGLETAGHATGTFNKTFSDVVPQTVQAAGLVSNFAENLIMGTDVPAENNPIYKFGKQIEEKKKEYLDYSPDPRLANNFWATDIPQGFASVAAVLASQGRSIFKDVGIKAATKYGVKKAVEETAKTLVSRPIVTGGVMMAVPEYDAAISAGASEDQAFEAFLKNYLLGGTEAIPIEHALSFINQVTGNRIMRTIKSGLVGSVEEAIQEALQTYVSNKVAAGTYDPDRDPMDGVIRSMLAGAVVGGGLAGVGGVASQREDTEDKALGKAEARIDNDPNISTGDPAVDAAIDAPYAEMAARLDDIDMTEYADKEAEDTEDKLENDVATFSAIEEENELSQQEYTPEEAGAIQAQAPLPGQAEQEMMLDDSEQTPAIAARQQQFTPSINDENEIPNNAEEFTPQEAAAVQAGAYISPSQAELGLGEDQLPLPVSNQPVVEPAKVETKPEPVKSTKTKSEPSVTKTPATETKVVKEEPWVKTIRDFESEISGQNEQEFDETVSDYTEELAIDKAAADEDPSQFSRYKLTEKKMEAINKEMAKRGNKLTKNNQKLEDARIEKETKQVEKFNKELSNALTLKPGARLRRLQTLDERTLDHPELNKRVAEELDKLQGALDEKAFAKQMKAATTQEKLDVISARTEGSASSSAMDDIKQSLNTLEANPDNIEAIKEANKKFEDAAETISKNDADMLSVEQAAVMNIVKEARAKFDKALEPERKKEAEANKEKTESNKNKNAERDRLLTNIAKSVKKGLSGQIDLDVKAFQDWRKKQGYNNPQSKYNTAMSKEEVLKKAAADFYVRAAKTETVRETEANAREMKNAAKNAAKAAIRQEFGLSEDADIEEYGYQLDQIDTDQEMVNSFSNVKKISTEAFLNKLSLMYPEAVVKPLKALFELSQKISKRFAIGGIEIYEGENTPGKTRGFHVFDPTAQREILFTSAKSKGETESHELIHMVAKAMIHNMSSLKFGNKSNSPALESTIHATNVFYDEIDKIYNNALKSYKDKLLKTIRKISSGQELSIPEKEFMNMVIAYHDSRGFSLKSDSGAAEYLAEIYNNLFEAKAVEQDRKQHELSYMFANSDELMAETFSNPFAMGIMATLSGKEEVLVKSDSYFRQLVDALKKFLSTMIKIHPVQGNYLEKITSSMEKMERSFLTGQDKVEEATIDLMDKLQRGAGNLFRSWHAQTEATEGKKKETLLNILNSTAAKVWKNKTLQSVADVQKIVDKINALTVKNKLNADHTKYIWAQIEKYRGELKEAKIIQQNSLEFSKGLDEFKESSELRKTVEDFAAVNLDDQSITNIRILEKGILDLVTGEVPDQKAYNIANKDKAHKYLKDLLPTAGKYATNPNIFGFSLKDLANPATFASVLAKYNTPVAQKLFKTLYGGMLSAKTQSQTEANTFMSQMYEIAKSDNLSEIDYVKAHMMGVAFTTTTNPNNPDYWVEVEKNLDTIIENAENKQVAIKRKLYKGATANTAKLELDAAKEIKRRVMHAKSMKGILSKGQQKLYDAFRTFIAKHEADAERNAKGVWGDESFHRFNNYMPTKALGKASKGDLTGDDPLVYNSKAHNLWEMLVKNKNYGKVTSSQNGATKARVSPKGYYYDYNIMSVANKYAAPLLFDIYATREIKTLNHLLNGATGNPVALEGKNIYDIMSPQAINGLNYQLKSIIGQYTIKDGETPAFLKQLYKFKDTLSTARLATGGQFMVQASSAVPASLIMHPKGFTKAMKILTGFERGFGNFKTLQDFIQQNGMSIQLRDYLFERFQTVEDVQAKGLARGVHNVTAKFEQSATYLLRSGDKFAARLVWFSAFYQAGGTIEKPTKDAILEAERAVGVLQNMSDISFAAPMFKADTNSHRMLIHMLFAFKSFSMNAAINTYYSAKHSLTSAEARKVFSSNMLMAAAYHAAALYLIKPLYGALSDWLFGDDDDEEEKNYSNWEYIKQNTMFDMAFGNVSPSVIDALLRYGYGRHEMAAAKEEGETFDPIMDSALYVPKTKGEAFQEGFGQYGDLYTVGEDVITILSKSLMESLDMLETSDEDAQMMAMYKLLQDVSTLTKIVPFRGDVIKLLKEKVKRMKAETGSNKGATGGEEGTEFVQDQEYESSETEGAVYE